MITKAPYKVVHFDEAQVIVLQDDGDGGGNLIATFTGENREYDAYAYSMFPGLLKFCQILVEKVEEGTLSDYPDMLKGFLVVTKMIDGRLLGFDLKPWLSRQHQKEE